MHVVRRVLASPMSTQTLDRRNKRGSAGREDEVVVLQRGAVVDLDQPLGTVE